MLLGSGLDGHGHFDSLVIAPEFMIMSAIVTATMP